MVISDSTEPVREGIGETRQRSMIFGLGYGGTIVFFFWWDSSSSSSQPGDAWLCLWCLCEKHCYDVKIKHSSTLNVSQFSPLQMHLYASVFHPPIPLYHTSLSQQFMVLSSTYSSPSMYPSVLPSKHYACYLTIHPSSQPFVSMGANDKCWDLVWGKHPI